MLERSVEIEADPVCLSGDLVIPPAAEGLVIFAHGSGSSRRSARNRQVAAALSEGHLATLLFDLLSVEEASERANVFDVELLCERLLATTRWAMEEATLDRLPIGYFGASTGAAAALCAAAELDEGIGAVVSRGGRPDMAGESCLERVRAPTLLIVGGADRAVLALNQQAATLLRCPHEIEILPGATHLFEEPGALEQVAALAGAWFTELLCEQQR